MLDLYQTRFHACERNLKCSEVREEHGKFRQSQILDSSTADRGASCHKARVVFITTQKWNPYKEQLDARLEDAVLTSESKDDPWPPFLEILNFVSAFRPKCIFPNTTHASTGLVEFYAIPKLFGSLLDSTATEEIARETSQFIEDYEIRHHTKVTRNPMYVDLLDWKGIHIRNLEQAFRKFEHIEFESAKYQSMWKEFFPTINRKDKQEAAVFIEGRTAESMNRAVSPEITVISSDDEGYSSPSETPAGTSDTEPVESSDESELVKDDTSEEAMSESEPGTLTPSVTTPISRVPFASPSTIQGQSSPIEEPLYSQELFLSRYSSEFRVSLSGFDRSVERRSLSNLAAGLQAFEYEFLNTAVVLTRQLRRFDQVLNQLSDDYGSNRSNKSKKRKKSTVPDSFDNSHQVSSIIVIDTPKEDNPDDPLIIWPNARASIAKLVELRSNICLYRKKGVEIIDSPS